MDRLIVLSLSTIDTVRPEVFSAILSVDVAHRPWRLSALALTRRRHLGSEARSAPPRREAGREQAVTQ